MFGICMDGWILRLWYVASLISASIGVIPNPQMAVFVQIDTLQNSTTYASPSSDSSLGLLVASNCTCGRVPYNLLSACAVCQGGNSVSYGLLLRVHFDEAPICSIRPGGPIGNLGVLIPTWPRTSTSGFALNGQALNY